jgi:hypothetical protein
MKEFFESITFMASPQIKKKHGWHGSVRGSCFSNSAPPTPSRQENEMALEMKYFVLKPRAKSGDDAYAIASQHAMTAFARAVSDHDPDLADSILAWAHKEREATLLMRVDELDAEGEGSDETE